MTGFKPDVSIIIPAYDEAETIGKVIAELLLLKDTIPSMEIIVIDDGSSDGTAIETIKFPSIILVKHPKNMGKGAALKTGFETAMGKVVVIQDADLEYSPCEIPHIVKPLLSRKVDVVYGTRFKSKPRGMSFIHFLGNIMLSKAASLLYQKNITDIMTGYKAFSSKVLKSVELKENGFSVEVELTAQVLQKGWKFLEVPIDYTYRSHGASKIRTLDGLVSFIRLLVNSVK